jgi:hypothetical protein
MTLATLKSSISDYLSAVESQAGASRWYECVHHTMRYLREKKSRGTRIFLLGFSKGKAGKLERCWHGTNFQLVARHIGIPIFDIRTGLNRVACTTSVSFFLLGARNYHWYEDDASGAFYRTN